MSTAAWGVCELEEKKAAGEGREGQSVSPVTLFVLRSSDVRHSFFPDILVRRFELPEFTLTDRRTCP